MKKMEGKDTGIVKNAREYGELSNDNPLKWRPQTIGKTKPPPSNPPLDPEDHNNNINNTNNTKNDSKDNNNNVTEEGGCTTPQGKGVGTEFLQSSKIEDIDELPHDDGPNTNQAPGGGGKNDDNDKNNTDSNNNITEEGGCTTPQGKSVGAGDPLQSSKIGDIADLPDDDDDYSSPNQIPGEGGDYEEEEFSLPTSLSSQDDEGHHSPSTGRPVDEGDAQRDIGLLDTEMSENGDRGFEEGNEIVSMPKSLSSQDDGGHRSSSAGLSDDVGGVKQATGDRRYEEGNKMFSKPKSLLSQDNGGFPPYLSMASDEGSVEQIMVWKEANMSENRELSMPKSLSSQTDGIVPHPFLPNVGINNVIPNIRFNNKKAINKAKKKARANASRMFKRVSSKKRGRMNAEKRMESLKNALTELKRDVILMKEKMNGLDNANNGKGSIIPLQIVYMMDDMKKIGREFARVYLPKIIGYVVFGSAMAALGYMKGAESLQE